MGGFAPGFLGRSQARARWPSGLRKLASGSILGSVASVPIIMTEFTAFPNKRLMLRHFVPTVDSSALNMKMSSNGGATYAGGATDYSYAFETLDSAGAASATFADNVAIGITNATVGNQTPEGVDAEITLWNTNDADHWPRVTWRTAYMDATATPRSATSSGTGLRRAAQIVNAIELAFFSSNIASGYWELYGYT